MKHSIRCAMIWSCPDKVIMGVRVVVLKRYGEVQKLLMEKLS